LHNLLIYVQHKQLAKPYWDMGHFMKNLECIMHKTDYMPHEFNPFATRYMELINSQASLDEERIRLNQDLEQYRSYDVDLANHSILANRRKIKELEKDRIGILSALNAKNEQIKALEKSVLSKWDPRYWFSDEEQRKVILLSKHKHEADQLSIKKDRVDQDCKTLYPAITNQEDKLQHWRDFDPLATEANINYLNSQLDAMTLEIEQVKHNAQQADAKLAVDGTMKSLLEELENFRQERNALQKNIADAEPLEKELSEATNPYKRAMIHQKTNDMFQVGSPGKVISNRKKIIEVVDRKIKKLEDRLKIRGQIASRDVKKIIIDGNNLCYQDKMFIGLTALRPLVQSLSSRFEILIVFDATIRKNLDLNNRDIKEYFNGVAEVHIVANKADETLLDSAADQDMYIISNDRFHDFPKKKVIRENRIIRHEILNGKVFVHDLDVNENLLVDDQNS